MNWGEQIKSTKLNEKQVDRVCKLFIIGDISSPKIAEIFNVKYHVINKIQSLFIPLYMKHRKGTVSMNLKTKLYYPKESHILEELELNYNDVQLTGWELEQFNKLD